MVKESHKTYVKGIICLYSATQVELNLVGRDRMLGTLGGSGTGKHGHGKVGKVMLSQMSTSSKTLGDTSKTPADGLEVEGLKQSPKGSRGWGEGYSY